MSHAGSDEPAPQTSSGRDWFVLFAISTLAFCWLAMQAVHELGHALNARWSGGTVVRVVLHPLEISRTDVNPNPHPQFVAWGGPVWGCLIPFVATSVLATLRVIDAGVGQFFAGFCLLANGVYIGLGVIHPVGDAEDLLRHGAPLWSLALFGVIAIIGAIDTLNIGEIRDLIKMKPPRYAQLAPLAHLTTRRAALTMTAVTTLVIALELAFYQTTP